MRLFSKALVVLAVAGLVGVAWALLALSQQPGDEGWKGEGSGSFDGCDVFKTWECYIDYRGVNPDIVVGTWLEPLGCYGDFVGLREYFTGPGHTKAGSGVWWNSDSTFGGEWDGWWEDLRGDWVPDTAYGKWEATWGGKTGDGEWWSTLRAYP